MCRIIVFIGSRVFISLRLGCRLAGGPSASHPLHPIPPLRTHVDRHLPVQCCQMSMSGTTTRRLQG